MKHLLRLFFVSLSFSVGLSSRAQNTTLLLDGSVLDTSYAYGDSIHASFLLTYISSAPYQGVLTLGYQTTNNGNIITDTVPNYELQVNFFPPQQATDVIFNIPVANDFFIDGGGHTVIVWPILSAPPVGTVSIDSVNFYINISGWANLAEAGTPDKLARIFPVPATDYITLGRPDNAPAADIMLVNIHGQILRKFRSVETNTRISLLDLPAGTYFIRYSDGVHPPEIHRFIKR